MPTKWLQERHNGSKNDTGIGFAGLDEPLVPVERRDHRIHPPPGVVGFRV